MIRNKITITMFPLRRATRSLRFSPRSRPFATTVPRNLEKPPSNENAAEWEVSQKKKPTGPHMTNTTSTIANDVPNVGADKAPPELLTSVDPNYVPKDSRPENTKRMTGGTQEPEPDTEKPLDLGVGEMEGGKFKIEPLRRTGEDGNTMRARLLCPFLFEGNDCPDFNLLLIICGDAQIRAGRGERSKVTFSSPLSQIPILRE